MYEEWNGIIEKIQKISEVSSSVQVKEIINTLRLKSGKLPLARIDPSWIKDSLPYDTTIINFLLYSLPQEEAKVLSSTIATKLPMGTVWALPHPLPNYIKEIWESYLITKTDYPLAPPQENRNISKIIEKISLLDLISAQRLTIYLGFFPFAAILRNTDSSEVPSYVFSVPENPRKFLIKLVASGEGADDTFIKQLWDKSKNTPLKQTVTVFGVYSLGIYYHHKKANTEFQRFKFAIDKNVIDIFEKETADNISSTLDPLKVEQWIKIVLSELENG